MDTPKYHEFMNPTLQALREGGGTLTNEEIMDAVARIVHLPELADGHRRVNRLFTRTKGGGKNLSIFQHQQGNSGQKS